MNKLKNFFKYFYDNHYRIERFSILFVSLCFCLMLSTGYAMYHFIDMRNVSLSHQAIYTTETQTSITGVPVHIDGIFASKDKTRGFILGRFDNMSNLPLNANDYSIVLHGYDNSFKNITHTKSEPTFASLTLYGSSGYFGIYLVDHNGFKSQIQNIILRANTSLYSKQASDFSDGDITLDESFSKFDQCQFAFNLGAKDTTELDCLNQDTEPTPEDFYKQAVLAYSEQSEKDNLESDLTEMSRQLNLIVEYYKRLDGIHGIAVPAMPDYIVGDSIESKDNRFVLNTTHHIDNYLDFDWRDTTLFNGGSYLDQVMSLYKSGYTNSDLFLRDVKKDFNNYIKPSMYVERWLFKDGTDLEDLNINGSSNERYHSVKSDCESYVNAVNGFIKYKIDYEFHHRLGLLTLESNLNSVNNAITLNSSDTLLRIY